MTGDLRRQFLRQRAQLLAGLRVQLVAGDVVGQQRIVMLRRRTLALLVPRRPVPAIARRPIGAFAVLRAPRPAAPLERLVALSWTSFALAFEPPPARTTLVALIATALERTILRTSRGATLTLAATPLESAWAPFPTGPAAALARTRRTVVRGAAVATLAALTRETPLLAVVTRPGEPAFTTFAALTALSALTARPGEPAFTALATLTREPAFTALPALTREPAFTALPALTREPAFLALAPLAGETTVPALTARPGRTAFLSLAALAGDTAFLTLAALAGESVLRAAFPRFRTPIIAAIVGALEGTAGLAVIALSTRVPLLPATGTAAPALRTAGAEPPGAGATALAGPGPSLAAAGIAPTTGRRVPSTVTAPPLAVVVAAAVLFRAHHVRHCA
ncbi:hypothetical protein [Actinomadura mexicana]|uniref:hypothetical protein n=1 Tax=Actinomadura mexicana TaxID=134959 RepID=UPI0015C5D5B4|nr:hypothetical protein [Actinomadura mexicana]